MPCWTAASCSRRRRRPNSAADAVGPYATATALLHRRAEPHGPRVLAPYPKNGYAKMTTARSTQIERDFKKLSNNGLTKIWRPIRSIADGTIGAAIVSVARVAQRSARKRRASKREPQSATTGHTPCARCHAAARGGRLRPDPQRRIRLSSGGEDGRPVEPGYDAAAADERGARNEPEKQWAQFPPALRQR